LTGMRMDIRVGSFDGTRMEIDYRFAHVRFPWFLAFAWRECTSRPGKSQISAVNVNRAAANQRRDFFAGSHGSAIAGAIDRPRREWCSSSRIQREDRAI
jgi:hypothetical protein